MKRALSVILVILQVALIIFLLVDVKLQLLSIGAFIIFSSIALGLWAIIAMRKSRFNVMPEPLHNALLITSGPYRLLRHPMYTAVILFAIGVSTMDYTLYRAIATLLLIVVLIIKLNREEKMLLKKFSEYENYKSSTYKLIPYIY